MKRIKLSLIALLPLLCFGAANDIKISQKNATDSGWIDRIFAPASGGAFGNASGFVTAIGAVSGNAIIDGAHGGTGVVNTGKTITIGGNVTTSGAFNLTVNLTGNTSVTFPTTGTLATLSGNETLGNKTLTTPIIGNATVDNLIGATNGNVTITGGSSGAVINVEPGANGNVTLTPSGTGSVIVAGGHSLNVAPANNTNTSILFGVPADNTGFGEIHNTAFQATNNGLQTQVWAQWGSAFPVGVVIVGPPIGGSWGDDLRSGQIFEVATNTNTGFGGMALSQYRNELDSKSYLSFQKIHNNTFGMPGAVAANETVGTIDWRADDGSSLAGPIFREVADVTGTVDGAVSTGVIPGRIDFRTANNSGTLINAATIDGTQKLILYANESMRVENSAGFISFFDTTNTTRTGYIQGNSGSDLTISTSTAIPIKFRTNGTTVGQFDGSNGDLNLFSTIDATVGGASVFTSGGIWATKKIIGGTIQTSGGAASWTAGTGSPEGILAAPVGSLYSRTDGGTGTTLYVKETGGSTNSGWVAK